ncbi:hypothetical protein MATL_G00188200 [Megalops atlanticus]|uniref:Uncharacterized protein n=1 Tax=Megalops atlanticus TaxID=7932 RepID=A0A9D3PMS0_MEGAT|nr:hypothetical protein MATL_G00188200 [Megalops atlanticus]
MRSFTLVLLLCLGYGHLTTSYKPFMQVWSKLIVTHHWPQTFCSVEHCDTHFDYWTLHGLWPDKGGTCNTSWHFNASQIEDLMPEMKKWWPDLLHPDPSNSTVFWKHEWQKHGTCAVQSEALDSEHKYFSKALELYHKLDLDGVLRKSNIVPSEKFYNFDDIEEAIYGFYNVKPKIQCIPPKLGENVQTLGQIEICFSKDFHLINCQKSELDNRNQPNDILTYGSTGYMVCQENKEVYYPPLIGKY